MNTTDSTGRENSYLIPLLLSCFFPISIISLVTHPMNCLYDMPATAVCLVSCYLNVFGFCLWCATLNGGIFFVVFPECVQVGFFWVYWTQVWHDPCHWNEWQVLNWAWISQKFFSFNPIVISVTAQMHIFSTVISHPNICSCRNLKRKTVIFFPPALLLHKSLQPFVLNIW